MKVKVENMTNNIGYDKVIAWIDPEGQIFLDDNTLDCTGINFCGKVKKKCYGKLTLTRQDKLLKNTL